MSSDVVCMALASVPSGEQRSRFLAVGLADNTVRIISLDPTVSQSYIFFALIQPLPQSETKIRIYSMNFKMGLVTFSGLLDTAEYAGSP